jgi:hypothetical protein
MPRGRLAKTAKCPLRPISEIRGLGPRSGSRFSQSKVQCDDPLLQVRDVLQVCYLKFSVSGIVEVGRFTSFDASKELEDSVPLLAPILAHLTSIRDPKRNMNGRLSTVRIASGLRLTPTFDVFRT